MRWIKIVNATTHVLNIREDNSVGIFRRLADLPSKQKFTMFFNTDATYTELRLEAGNQLIIINMDDVSDAAEIKVYETPTQKIEWRVSKLRLSITDSTAFDAVRKDASSRVKIIEKSHASLVMLEKQVKLCPAQCQNLVQTCLEGVKEMKEAYNEKSERDMWRLFSSEKLGQLISSLDKLLSTLGSIQDLLQACGSNWCSMALVVSLPLPPPERIMYSRFDALVNELHWNLETIHYALHLNGGVEFKWIDRKVRYVLERIAGASGAKVTVAEDMELEQSRRLASEDREHLLSQLQNGSILVPGNPLLLGFKFATDHWGEKLAADLQKRLKGSTNLSNDYSSIPDCLWINNADLNLRHRLSGKRCTSKSVWKGEWCGRGYWHNKRYRQSSC